MSYSLRSYLFVFFILSSLHGSNGLASACCTSAAAFGAGRLLMWETFAVGLQSAYAHTLSTFDRDTERWSLAKSDYQRSQLRSNLWALFALSEKTSLFFIVPWSFETIRLPGDETRSLALDDVRVGFRHQLVDIGAHEFFPALALLASIAIPGDSQKTNWGVTFGTSLEKNWTPWYLQLNAETTLFFPSNSFSDADAFQTSLVTGVEVTKNVVLSLMGRFNLTGHTYYDGERLDDAPHSRETSVAFSASWRFNPHFTLQSSISSGIPIPHINYGENTELAVNLGLRYGFF